MNDQGAQGGRRQCREGAERKQAGAVGQSLVPIHACMRPFASCHMPGFVLEACSTRETPSPQGRLGRGAALPSGVSLGKASTGSPTPLMQRFQAQVQVTLQDTVRKGGHSEEGDGQEAAGGRCGGSEEMGGRSPPNPWLGCHGSGPGAGHGAGGDLGEKAAGLGLEGLGGWGVGKAGRSRVYEVKHGVVFWR